jgi:hypothetical protein
MTTHGVAPKAEVELTGAGWVTARWNPNLKLAYLLDCLLLGNQAREPVLSPPQGMAWLERHGSPLDKGPADKIVGLIRADPKAVTFCRLEDLPRWSLSWGGSLFLPSSRGYPGHPTLTVPVAEVQLLGLAVRATATREVVTAFDVCLIAVRRDAERVGCEF